MLILFMQIGSFFDKYKSPKKPKMISKAIKIKKQIMLNMNIFVRTPEDDLSEFPGQSSMTRVLIDQSRVTNLTYLVRV